MRLVVDTNILFSVFWKRSMLPRVMASQELELYSPEFALEEIKRYEQEIRAKTGLSKEEFNAKREELAILVGFVPLEEYQKFLKQLTSTPDKDDIDFLALALKLKCPLWSNDKALKRQGNAKIMSTKELLAEL